jgi:uncharacterized protein YcbK (DUF882 family)
MDIFFKNDIPKLTINNHFTKKEMDCNCGCGFRIINPELLQRLHYARELAGIPFNINSWCRCDKHNAKVGGVKGSSHTKGYAVDIKVKGDRERFIILKALIMAGFERMGVYSWGIHVDVDDTKDPQVIWRG